MEWGVERVEGLRWVTMVEDGSRWVTMGRKEIQSPTKKIETVEGLGPTMGRDGSNSEWKKIQSPTEKKSKPPAHRSLSSLPPPTRPSLPLSQWRDITLLQVCGASPLFKG